jgi:chromosome segregation ATPase
LESLKSILEDKIRNQFANDSIDEKPTKKRISEIKGQMEIAEEQLVLNKNSKEQFGKYHNKYADEVRELEAALQQYKKMSSNLEKTVAKVLKSLKKYIRIGLQQITMINKY